jgi:hypothetical protein
MATPVFTDNKHHLFLPSKQPNSIQTAVKQQHDATASGLRKGFVFNNNILMHVTKQT